MSADAVPLLARIPIRDDCVQAIPQQSVAAAEFRCTYPHERRDVPASLARVLAAGARGGVLLSTCNRTEFYLSEPAEAVSETVWALLAERLGVLQEPTFLAEPLALVPGPDPSPENPENNPVPARPR